MQIVRCYGKEQGFGNAGHAIEFYMDCYNNCDPASSEAQRYSLIIARLFQNLKNNTTKTVTDEMEN